MADSVAITDYYELLALHRVIMEAKFSAPLHDSAIVASPFVAAIADRVLNALIEKERQANQPEKAEQWAAWRMISPERREWGIALTYAKHCGCHWYEWSKEQRHNYVQVLLSPFTISLELLESFCQEVDRIVEDEQ
jgi:hypothetical protein